MKHKTDLENITQLKVKEIQKILTPSETNKKEAKIDITNIFKGYNRKLVSLNYRIAKNILKTAVNRNEGNRACILCKSRAETIYHLFFECKELAEMREDFNKYTKAIRGNNFNPETWEYMIFMQHLENKMEYEIISLYKKHIWLYVLAVRFDKKDIGITRLRLNYEYDIRFYIEYCTITKVGVG